MRSIVIGQSRKDHLKLLIRKLVFILSAVLICFLLIYTAFRQWTHMSPPDDAGPPLPNRAEVEPFKGGKRLVVGDSWMVWQDGLWRLQLGGDPRTMGHSHGLLAGEITTAFERHLMTLMDSYITSSWRKWWVENAVRWRFRQLPENMPAPRLVELAAFSRTIADVEDLPLTPFQRLVYYHALHDLTQRLDGSPLIGCTAFAAWGKNTVNGHLIVGRNFDFEGGPIFDREKAIMTIQVPGKIPFVSVSWPGMMGVVTGVNARRLYVSINAARTDDSYQAGIPMGFLIREILEEASDIKEALAIIRRNKVMVAEALLIADGKVPDAVVVELSPRLATVRRSPNGMVGVANHFLDPKYRGDASNNWLRRYTTSDARYHRLTQLLSRYSGHLDARTAAMILRNRAALNDEPLALGNRNAIDALIATHGVIVDLQEMILWVSKGPHLLGAFVPIDLKPIFAIPLTNITQPEPIPQDPLLDSAEHKQYEQAQNQLILARQLLQSGSLQRALDLGRRATLMLPDLPDAQLLMGDILWSMGQKEEAKQYYGTFLKFHPPYLRDKERVLIQMNR